MDGKQRDRPSVWERMGRWWSRWCSDVLMIMGAAFITVGVGSFCFPAGLITGGGFLIAAGVLTALGGGDGA